MTRILHKFFGKKGAGWITGASDDDPAGIGTYAYAGSRFGFDQLWTMLFSLPLMMVVQEMCARIALVSGQGVISVFKKRFPRPVVFGIVMLLIVANTINIGANIGAMAASLQLFLNVPFTFLAIVCTLVTLLLEIAVPYKVYARYLRWLTLSLFAYVITAILTTANWGEVLAHVVAPTWSFNKEFVITFVAILGTTISPYLFFWQASEEIEDEIVDGKKTIKARKGATPDEIRDMRSDVGQGMLFSNLIAFFVILTAAQTLFPHGIVIQTAHDAAISLAPIAGPFASIIFAIGIIGTGLLSIPVLAASGAYAFAEMRGWKAGLSLPWHRAHGFYIIIAIAMLAGLGMNFLGIDPIRALIITSVINGVAAPVLLAFILICANTKAIMGKWTNGRVANSIGWVTVGVMGLAALLMFIL